MHILQQNLISLIHSSSATVNTELHRYVIRNRAVLLIVSVIGTTPLPKMLWNCYVQRAKKRILADITSIIGVVLLLLLCTAYLIDGSFNPFLYFRFWYNCWKRRWHNEKITEIMDYSVPWNIVFSSCVASDYA